MIFLAVSSFSLVRISSYNFYFHCHLSPLHIHLLCLIFFLLRFTSLYCFQVLSISSIIYHNIMQGYKAEYDDMKAQLLTICLNKPQITAVHHSLFCSHSLPYRPSLRFTFPSFIEIFSQFSCQ